MMHDSKSLAALDAEFLCMLDEPIPSDHIIAVLSEHVKQEFGATVYTDLVNQPFFLDGLDDNVIIVGILEYIDFLSKNSGASEIFTHIKTDHPSLYGRTESSIPCTFVRLPSHIIQNLPLKYCCKIGTWGKYRVLEKDHVIIPETNQSCSDDIVLFIVHCNLHNSPSRQQNIQEAKDRYSKLLESVGITQIIHFSANEISTEYDMMYSKKLHTNHKHWSPHYIASIMKRMYYKYPRSIVLTHRYIGSLLIDNELLFTMHFLIDVDSSDVLQRCLRDVYNHLKNKSRRGPAVPFSYGN